MPRGSSSSRPSTTSQEFRRLVWGITGEKPAADVEPRYEGVCPYRGLEAFGPDDARFFFGRENLTDWLVSDLRREVRACREECGSWRCWGRRAAASRRSCWRG